MKSSRSSVFRLTIAGFFAFVSVLPLAAAEFSSGLDAQLQRAQSADFISAIVILPSPIDIRVLDLKLHDERAGLAQRHAEIMAALHCNADAMQPAFRAELEAAKTGGVVTGYTAYWIENLFVIQATKEFVESLRNRGDVLSVGENFRGELTELPPASERGRRSRHVLDSLYLATGIRASGAYRVNTELGITGQGSLVASLDTGVDGAHPALASRWRGQFAPWQECWRDAIGSTTAPHDGPSPHGTFVMGTMVGREFSGLDTFWVGCAPNALWIADNAINQGVGQPFNNDIIDAFQWFADPDGDPETLDDVPDVISNNWGVNIYLGYPQCYAFWNTVILNCEAAGPVITWSAGGEGPAGVLRSPAIYSINAYQIFTTGSVDASDYDNPPFPVTSWSTRGPTPCTPAEPDNIKPEIVSPGIDILTCSNNGDYTDISGGAVADAHTAGIVALMREACPDCDYITIKQTLFDTAIDFGAEGEDNSYGHGFIDAYAAVLALMPIGRCCYDTLCADTFETACNSLGGTWTPGATCAGDGCLTAVDDLTIHVYGNDAVLRWTARPPAAYYRIYTSENSGEPWTLIDSTTAATYTHINGGTDPMLFYYVTANHP